MIIALTLATLELIQYIAADCFKPAKEQSDHPSCIKAEMLWGKSKGKYFCIICIKRNTYKQSSKVLRARIQLKKPCLIHSATLIDGLSSLILSHIWGVTALLIDKIFIISDY